MDRRELLAGAWVLGVGCAAAMRPALAAGPPSNRRVRPVDAAWPSEREWSRLKRRLTGRLIRPTPLLEACRADSAAPGCTRVVANLRNPYYIGDQPAGTQVSGWLDAWQSAPSAYAVECRTPGDAVAAVNFAREHCLRLVVKGVATATRARRMRRTRCSSGRARCTASRCTRPSSRVAAKASMHRARQ